MEINFVFLLCLFSLSALFLQLGMDQKKGFGTILITFSLCIPVILATFRQVGTDTPVYYSVFSSYQNRSLMDHFINEGWKEFGNSLFIFIGNLVNSFNVYLFLYSFFTLLFVILALKALVKKELIGISFFLYLCLLYPISLNTMRQSLAVAIIFYSYKFLLNRSFFRFFLGVLIAAQFHISSVVMLPIYFLINEQRKLRKGFFVLILSSIVVAIVSYKWIFSFLSFFLNDERYNAYINYTEPTTNYLFFFNFILFLGISFFQLVHSEKNKKNQFYFAMLAIGLLLGVTGFISPFIKRISIFFDVIQILLIPDVVLLYRMKIENSFMLFFVYLFGVAYFILFYVILKFSTIIPYILGSY
ncbi:EpsG family protein [Enterococcus ratti]|uniref:EpsG family protein n=1 Tax=Enterococcus ratti TaxID=150033 RepID=UPI0035193614